MTAWSLAVSATAALAAGEAATSPPASRPAFVIQAHRGAGTLAPENTLPTFELAWQLGVIPEADVRTTKDGVLVAFHDDNFKRLVKGAPADLRSKGVGQLAWDELKKLDVGAWKGRTFAGQHIPRIADAFAAMQDRPERRIYLDIKKVPIEQLADLVRQYRVERQVILASTVYPLICRWKELLPNSETLLWMGGPEASLAERLTALRAVDFKGVTQLQIHVRAGDPKAQDPLQPSSAFLRSVANELRPRGILFQTLPWDCSDPAVYHRLMDLGVQSFASDAPKVTLEAMKTHRPKP